MPNNEQLISVLTPTWNRADYLVKVWNGLNSQTFKNFEWIVADDGSTDQTQRVIADLACNSPFPIKLITASCRVGKSKIDNLAVSHATGSFIIWCDSDDQLLPLALETLMTTWDSIPQTERNNYCGVTALCKTGNGILGNQFYTGQQVLDLSWNVLYHKLQSDLVILTKAELLKSCPFPEVDFLTPESSVWNRIGILKTRFVPVVLQSKSYNEQNCLSFSNLMAYNRGYAHALAITKPFVWLMISKRERLLKQINYLRYCRHGEIRLIQAIKLWNAPLAEAILLLLLKPLAEIVAISDTLQGKVRQTHRDFAIAVSKASYLVQSFNDT